jgi:excisionase family DNA binding protein
MQGDTPSRPLGLTVHEAAARLRISEATARRLIDAGQIPVVRVGRKQLIPAVWIDRLFDQAIADHKAAI